MKNRLDDELICPYCGAVQTEHEPEGEDGNGILYCQKCGLRFGYDVTVIHSYYVWREDVADELRV